METGMFEVIEKSRYRWERKNGNACANFGQIYKKNKTHYFIQKYLNDVGRSFLTLLLLN